MKKPNVIILAQPRTGSHMVCSIFGMNGWGPCYEFMNERVAGSVSFLPGDHVTNVRALRRLAEQRSEHCPRAMSVHLSQVSSIGSRCEMQLKDAIGMLCEAFHPVRFIATVRRDKAAQAVSWFFAMKCHWWERVTDDKLPPYDEEELISTVQMLGSEKYLWEPYFEMLNPLIVCYEDACTDIRTTMTSMGLHVGSQMALENLDRLPVQKVRHWLKDQYTSRLRERLAAGCT